MQKFSLEVPPKTASSAVLCERAFKKAVTPDTSTRSSD